MCTCEQERPLQECYQEVLDLFGAKRYADSMEVCDHLLASRDCGAYRVYLLLGKAMNQYYLGLLTGLEATVSAMALEEMPEDVRCRWIMLKGRVLAHRKDPQAFALFAEAEEAFRGLAILQDEAWAQLSAARLAVMLEQAEQAIEAARRVTFVPYGPKARLLEAEGNILAGNVENALNLATMVGRGEFGPPDDVDLARTAYVKALALSAVGRLVDASFLLGEARNRAITAAQRDYELINTIEALRTRLETKGG